MNKKTIQVTIQNHTRLLDAEMVDKLAKGEIKVTAEKNMYEEICSLFKLIAPLEKYKPVANTGNYIVRAGYWYHDDLSDIPAYPISSFFVDEVPAEKNIKVSFGMQKSHVDVIRSELEKYDKIETDANLPKSNMLYSYHLWQDVGKKIGWDPLTICLSYFKKVVVPETPDKDAAFVQMYEALKHVMESSFTNGYTKGEEALAAADKFIKPVN